VIRLRKQSGKGEIMQRLPHIQTAFASLQWFIFLFANTIVVPISVGTAFTLDAPMIAELIRNSLVLTGLACVLQGTIGHRFPLMEGHSGLIWGLVLNLCFASSALGMSLVEIGGGIASGMILSGAVVMILAAFRLLKFMEKLFTPMVMSVFLFLLTIQLITIFFDGMFKLDEDGSVVWPETAFAFAVAAFVALIKIKGSERVSNFSILIGIAVGWLLHIVLFPSEVPLAADAGASAFRLTLFPLGEPNMNVPIIVVTFVATFINLSNTITATQTAGKLYNEEMTPGRMRRSYMLNGVYSMLGGSLGLVQYAPFASTIGFLQSTRIFDRKPFLIGGALLSGIGLLPSLSGLLATMPVTVGNAVLLVAYFQLLGTSLNSIRGYTFNSVTIHRLAIPVLVGVGIMFVDPSYYNGLPALIQPLLANGFIVGVLLSILLELLIRWDRLSEQAERPN
jgi:xanthine/uracil permease